MEDIGKQMIQSAQKLVPSISIRETYSRLNTSEGLVVLDVREPDEWAEGHINGATLLARGRIEGRVEELIPDKTTCIVAH